MEARIWFRPEMAGDETSLWISCGVALHTSCWNLIVPVSCWNSVASDSPIWKSVYFRVVAETVESSRTKIHWSLCTAVRSERFEKNYCIAKIYWLRCIRRGVICSYKEEKAVSYLLMNVIIRTDGPVVLTKPPRTRRGELDISSEEHTRIFSAAQLSGL